MAAIQSTSWRNDRLEARNVEVVGYSGNDILFRSEAEPAVASGDQVVVTQIREGGAGIRVEVRE